MNENYLKAVGYKLTSAIYPHGAFSTVNISPDHVFNFRALSRVLDVVNRRDREYEESITKMISPAGEGSLRGYILLIHEVQAMTLRDDPEYINYKAQNITVAEGIKLLPRELFCGENLRVFISNEAVYGGYSRWGWNSNLEGCIGYLLCRTSYSRENTFNCSVEVCTIVPKEVRDKYYENVRSELLSNMKKGR